MLRVAVCDDEKSVCEHVCGLVRAWGRERGAEVSTSAFASADQLLFSLGDGAPDVALLDIEMPGTDGMELARRLRADGAPTQVIFVTGIIDHVFEGYDVDAVSYLLKPVREGRLFSALDRARARLGRAEPALVVEDAGETVRVPLSRICVAEARGHATELSLADGSRHACSQGIARMEEELAARSGLFFRAHRSYLVNLAHIRRITRREVEMDTGAVVPISRGRWEPLNQAWLAWCRGALS